jgi:hypothetical protein
LAYTPLDASTDAISSRIIGLEPQTATVGWHRKYALETDRLSVRNVTSERIITWTFQWLADTCRPGDPFWRQADRRFTFPELKGLCFGGDFCRDIKRAEQAKFALSRGDYERAIDIVKDTIFPSSCANNLKLLDIIVNSEL